MGRLDNRLDRFYQPFLVVFLLDELFGVMVLFIFLFTSSISTSGFSVFVFFKHWITLPGIAPMYVLRWPLISATSVMPPTENRKYSRCKARAIDRAIEVFPTPGGPTKQSILPWVVPFRLLTAMNSFM